MKKEIIPVFFAADNGYVPYLSVAIHSLLTNADPKNEYRLVILSQDISIENQGRLKRLEKPHGRIEFVNMQDRINGIADRSSNYLRCDFFTLTIYYRLFIPAMFPEYDKAIYIDSDVVLPGDISELFAYDLGDNLIGACRDESVQTIPELVDYMDNGVGVGHENYINSGVLLMNLKKLRDVQLDQRFLEVLNQYHFDTIAPDQDYINVLCHGNILYLPECWDAMPGQNKPELAAPRLIHYNLFFKPWCYDGIQYSEVFWQYARESGYLTEIEEKKRNYSDAQKEADSECLAKLIRTGAEIAARDFNFRTVFNSGKERRLI